MRLFLAIFGFLVLYVESILVDTKKVELFILVISKESLLAKTVRIRLKK